jgi:class 3 adenylate cyclase
MTRRQKIDYPESHEIAMEDYRRFSKLAVILHADIAGSTAMVQQNEVVAHERIKSSFRRFSDVITSYQGSVRELRGDALVARFNRASDAVAAALVFQENQRQYIDQLDDDIRPELRIGIALGEVIIDDHTVTGAGVVLAQRVEQLSVTGGICVTAAVHETLPKRMPFDREDLGYQGLKGFEETVRVYSVTIRPGEVIPPPDTITRTGLTLNFKKIRRAIMIVGLIISGGAAISSGYSHISSSSQAAIHGLAPASEATRKNHLKAATGSTEPRVNILNQYCDSCYGELKRYA